MISKCKSDCMDCPSLNTNQYGSRRALFTRNKTTKHPEFTLHQKSFISLVRSSQKAFTMFVKERENENTPRHCVPPHYYAHKTRNPTQTKSAHRWEKYFRPCWAVTFSFFSPVKIKYNGTFRSVESSLWDATTPALDMGEREREREREKGPNVHCVACLP